MALLCQCKTCPVVFFIFSKGHNIIMIVYACKFIKIVASRVAGKSYNGVLNSLIPYLLNFMHTMSSRAVASSSHS